MKNIYKTLFAPAALVALSIPLSSCGDSANDDGVAATSETMSEALSAADDLSAVAGAVETIGLEALFSGPGSYTLLAPTDSAFTALGDRASELQNEENSAIMAGLLRNHILPGHLTVETIRDAVEQNGSAVEIRSLGEGVISFSMDGDALSVSRPDGGSAVISGGDISAENGVVIPINAVLIAETDA